MPLEAGVEFRTALRLSKPNCGLLVNMFKLPVLALLATLPLAAQVKITQGNNHISVDIDGKPYTTFFYGPDVPKPYFIRSAPSTGFR